MKLEADAPPPPPPGGDAGGMPPAGNEPPPGGDPMGGGLGGDPMGGGAGGAQQPRKPINVTTWEDALRDFLGKNKANKQVKNNLSNNSKKEDKPKPKSLIQ